MHRKCTTVGILLTGLTAVLPPAKVEATAPTSRDQQVQIVAEEMCCKGCARKVSGQLYAARGVKSVKVDMKTRVVTVSLPHPNAATLGQLWHAVEQGEGGPSKLVTAEATYTLVRPKVETGQATPTQQANSPMQIVIDNLHCKGCAKKIAAELYTIKGVARVSVDMQKELLIIEVQPNVKVSPWQFIDAVAKANERPLVVLGSHGKLAIEWRTKRASKSHQQAQQTTIGGIQR